MSYLEYHRGRCKQKVGGHHFYAHREAEGGYFLTLGEEHRVQLGLTDPPDSALELSCFQGSAEEFQQVVLTIVQCLAKESENSLLVDRLRRNIETLVAEPESPDRKEDNQQ